MNTIGVNKSGIAVGLVLGGYHLMWSLLVAAGWGQAIIDFILWVHFIKPAFVIEPFGIERAAILVLATALIGYAIGAAFAMVWNRLHRA